MMKLLISCLTVLTLLIAEKPLYSQVMKWKEVAPNILKTGRNGPGWAAEYGAIATNGKIVVAGWGNMVLSLDYGATWTKLTSPLQGTDYVTDIAIYDDQTFAFSAKTGLYLTNDQGKSWQTINFNSLTLSLIFDGSASLLTAIIPQTSALEINLGGSPILNTLPIDFIASVRHAADGSLRILGAKDGSTAWLFSSVDHGKTWIKTTLLGNGDDYSFIADQSDPNRFVAINENLFSRIGGNSNLFLTTDNGVTWNSVYSHNLGNYADLSGDGATGCHDYFTGTTTNGVLRSGDKGLTWNIIGGPPMSADSRAITAVDDSLLFVIDTLGSIWATDPVSGSVGTTVISGEKFFQQLTIAPCDTSALATILFSNLSCGKLDISSVELLGLDTSEYAIIGSLSKPTVYPDSVHIRFTPDKSGKTDARLMVTYANGTTATVDLSVTVSLAPLSLSQGIIFSGDTISACSADSTQLILSSPCSLDLSSISINGPDASSFFLTGKNSAVLPADSLVKVLCIPQHSGQLKATLHIVASDGRTWDIPISLFAPDPLLQIQPLALFVNDSLPPCSSQIDSVLLRALCSLNIISVSITGTDSASFTIVGKQIFTLPADSILVINCTSRASGLLSASVHLVSAAGSSWDIPLAPFIKPMSTIGIDQTKLFNVTTDTIGGDVIIPIVLLHTGDPVDAQFTIHYDHGSLIYHGVFDTLNSDLTIGNPNPNSATISYNSERDTVLFARFSFYPLDSNCIHITLDSLRGMPGTTTCLGVLPNSGGVDVCSSAGCSTQALAQFLRNGKTPQLSVIPNPSSGNLTIATSSPLGFARISVVDKLGVERYSRYIELTKNITLNLDYLSSGIYFIRVSGINPGFPVIIEK